MKKNNFSFIIKNFKYRFVNYFSRGFKNQIILFCICGIIITFILGCVVRLLFVDNTTGWSCWQTLMHLIDQGTVTGDELDDKKYLFVMLFITFVGMVFTSTLIGIIGNAIGEIMDEINKGHSPVVEKDHGVILGFNYSANVIINEIEEIHKSSGDDKTVVIVGSSSKDEMEHIAKEQGWIAKGNRKRHSKKNTDPGMVRRIYRSGELVSYNTYDMCDISNASYIIVNGADDFENLKILMSLTGYLKKHHAYIEDYAMPVVVAVMDEFDNFLAAKNIVGLYNEKDNISVKYKNEYKIRIIFRREIMFRMNVFASMQQGLSHIITDLMSDAGPSIGIIDGLADENAYLNNVFTGKNIREITSCVFGGIPIGFSRCDDNNRTVVKLDPSPDERYTKGDSLIYLSDHSGLSVCNESSLKAIASPCKKTQDKAKSFEKVNFLTIGWKNTGDKFTSKLGKEGLKASDFYVIKDDPYNWENLYNEMENHPYWFDKNDDRHLTNINIMSSEGYDAEEADNGIMLILLNLQNYLKQRNYSVNIVSQMNFPQNQAMIELVNPDVFIISYIVVSRFMVQIAENPRKFYVFKDLLSHAGKTLALRPFSMYVDTSEPFNFQGIVTEVQNRSDESGNTEIPLGWIRIEHTGNQGTEVVLSPDQHQRTALFEDKGNCCFKDYRLVVIASVPGMNNKAED